MGANIQKNSHPNLTGDATGSSDGPLTKPVDKPPKQYTANESVPEDSFHAEPLDESLMENPQASRNP